MSAAEVQSYLDFILPLVKECGNLLLEARNIKAETKDEHGELVTIYDRKIEEVLITNIQQNFPTHKFIGEEESSDKKSISELTDTPTWIIDPIDGTANFVHGVPITCISVGLTINKKVVLGVVNNPYMEELYTSIRGQGAYLNGQKIHTSGVEEISKAVFNYELSLGCYEKHRELYLYRLKHLIGAVHGIRSMGSAVLGLCYVAKGVTDAYQCDGLFPWDVAAGSLIVEEAGGCLRDTMGHELNIMKPNYIATATKKLCDQFMELERKADEERLANKNKETMCSLIRK